jgi:hypothetical protein
MHDFIQSLSFQAQHSPVLARTATEALRSVMRSFDDEVPAYHPSPRQPKRSAKRRAGRKPSSLTNNS